MSGSKHLFLTGFRGTGKSTVGRLLAQRLAMSSIDLDEVIEQRAGKSIRAIFQEGGESLFRDLESQALEMVVQGSPAVIALGGGAILRETNRRRLHQTGICFWLDADAETISGRLQGDESTAERRPALTELPALEEIRHLIEQRQPLYQRASDHRIDAGSSDAEQIATQILEIWRSEIGHGKA